MIFFRQTRPPGFYAALKRMARTVSLVTENFERDYNRKNLKPTPRWYPKRKHTVRPAKRPAVALPAPAVKGAGKKKISRPICGSGGMGAFSLSRPTRPAGWWSAPRPLDDDAAPEPV